VLKPRWCLNPGLYGINREKKGGGYNGDIAFYTKNSQSKQEGLNRATRGRCNGTMRGGGTRRRPPALDEEGQGEKRQRNAGREAVA
jgi:hypothetical protein